MPTNVLMRVEPDSLRSDDRRELPCDTDGAVEGCDCALIVKVLRYVISRGLNRKSDAPCEYSERKNSASLMHHSRDVTHRVRGGAASGSIPLVKSCLWSVR